MKNLLVASYRTIDRFLGEPLLERRRWFLPVLARETPEDGRNPRPEPVAQQWSVRAPSRRQRRPFAVNLARDTTLARRRLILLFSATGSARHQRRGRDCATVRLGCAAFSRVAAFLRRTAASFGRFGQTNRFRAGDRIHSFTFKC